MSRIGGNPGNKGGGRKPIKIQMAFFAKLDKALPSTIDFCAKIIAKYKDSDERSELEVGLRAAAILMSKAPERVHGPGPGGEHIVKQITGMVIK